MKHVLIVATIFIAAVGLFFMFKSDNGSEAPDKVASFRVAVLDTDVSKKQAEEQEFSKIEKETEAFAGDQLKTSITGRATILQPNDAIASLGKNTTITLAAIDPDGGSKIKLESGDIWSKIKRLSGQDYEVETENMVAAVRGTAFAVRFYGSGSDLLVLEGIVRAKVKDPKTSQIIPGLEIEVKTGFKISIDSKNLPKILSDIKIKAITADDLEPDIIKDNLDTLEKPFELIVKPTSSPSPVTTRLVIPTKSIDPISTVKPTPSPTPTIRPTPTPTPEPVYIYAHPPQTTIQSVTPKELDREINPKFAINGTKLFGTKSVLLNKTSISFVVIDESTIFATANPNLLPGIYDVSIITSGGATLTLPSAINIR